MTKVIISCGTRNTGGGPHSSALAPPLRSPVLPWDLRIWALGRGLRKGAQQLLARPSIPATEMLTK